MVSNRTPNRIPGVEMSRLVRFAVLSVGIALLSNSLGGSASAQVLGVPLPGSERQLGWTEPDASGVINVIASTGPGTFTVVETYGFWELRGTVVYMWRNGDTTRQSFLRFDLAFPQDQFADGTGNVVRMFDLVAYDAFGLGPDSAEYWRGLWSGGIILAVAGPETNLGVFQKEHRVNGDGSTNPETGELVGVQFVGLPSM
jgi:hypothetical protein